MALSSSHILVQNQSHTWAQSAFESESKSESQSASQSKSESESQSKATFISISISGQQALNWQRHCADDDVNVNVNVDEDEDECQDEFDDAGAIFAFHFYRFGTQRH